MDRTVFRLRQLPLTVDRLDVVNLLSHTLGIDHSTIRIFSLAQSVNPYLPGKTATLMFRGCPEIQDALYEGARKNVVKVNDEWKISDENSSHRFILDTHFRGLTPLHDPTTHATDCIAISGLSSHPFGSWQSKGGSKDFMWIRDALPKSLPNIRPILYGYDTTLVNSNSFQSIFDIGHALVNQLYAHGWRSATTKPLIFLAHSLGGIVLKQAFVSLANSLQEDEQLIHVLSGAIFFGVPNFGMEQSCLLAMVEGQSNEHLVMDLEINSKYLKTLDDQFSGLSHLENLLLYWGYETRTSPTVARDTNGKWSRTGTQEILVTPHSATRGQYQSIDQKNSTFPINEDHSNMVKFSDDDPDYALVAQRLGCIIEGINTRRSTFATQTHYIAREITVTSMDKSKAVRTDDEDLINVIVDSLKAPERDRRFEEIEPKFHNTFDWVYDLPESGLNHWLQRGSGMFWINGKPASGKSTLMKFIFQDKRTTRLLSDWRTNYPHICIGFFFHYRGTALQKSFEGLLRSILSQIITQQPKLCLVLTRLFDKEEVDNKRITSNDWTLQKLQASFYDILTQKIEPLYLTFFLDALDEYDGPKEFICQFLKDIIQSPQPPTNKIKICFSSRPWEIFITQFRDLPGFTVQDFTQDDIKDYCLGTMTSEQMPKIALEHLIPDITSLSQGVFLWVRLVVKDLAEAFNANKSIEELQSLLKSLPIELDEYYAEIIERIPHNHRRKAYIMLETAVRSENALSPEEFMTVVDCAESTTYESYLKKYLEVDGRRCDALDQSSDLYFADTARRQSRTYCGGLVEVVGIYPRIQVLHQTVQDFVSDLKFKQLVLEDEAKITTENRHSFIAKYNIFKLSCRSSGDEAKIPTGNGYPKYDLSILRSGHAFRSIMQSDVQSHARLAEKTTMRSLKKFLDSLPASVLGKIDSLPRPISITTPLEFAVYFHLPLYIAESWAANNNLLRDSNDKLIHMILLGTAGDKNMRLEMAQFLHEKGFKFKPDLTLAGLIFTETFYHEAIDDFSELSKTGLLEFISFIFNSGELSPNIVLPDALRPNRLLGTSLSRTLGIYRSIQFNPLHYAFPDLAELLLHKGAHVNGLDSIGMTPLDYACLNNRYRVISDSTTAKNLAFMISIDRINFKRQYKLIHILVQAGGKRTKASTSGVTHLMKEFSHQGYPTEPLQDYLLGPNSLIVSERSFRQSLNTRLYKDSAFSRKFITG